MLVCWFGGNHPAVTRAIGEVRPLLAERGCTIGTAHLKDRRAPVRRLGAAST
ncbi:hypothetical protein [Streptomyces sp. NPDC026666]|uniref:hypothetical protein n=1 Tax=Streptomyces sp. NPDC026666 TaxID=3154799 RepID=UPI0034559320